MFQGDVFYPWLLPSNLSRHQAACFFTQATYLSIQPCRNLLLSEPIFPDASNNPSLAWMKASGWPSVGTSRYASTLRKCCCARAVPVAPTETPNTPAGLPVQALCPYGREAWSIAFLRTPGIERLYSAVTNRRP